MRRAYAEFLMLSACLCAEYVYAQSFCVCRAFVCVRRACVDAELVDAQSMCIRRPSVRTERMCEQLAFELGRMCL